MLTANETSGAPELKSSWSETSFSRFLARHSVGRRILGAVGPKLIRYGIDDFQMLLNLEDQWGVSKFILRHGAYDPDLCAVVKSLVKPDARCIDIGANIGFWSLYLVQQVKAEKVLAIEPEPSNVSLLDANIAINGLSAKVHRQNCALGNAPGMLKLYLSEDNFGDHQLYPTDQSRRAVDVKVHRLDDLLELTQFGERVDFIKMDIQGYEPFAIDGMTETLKRNTDVVLLTEWWPAGIRRAGRDPEQTLATLAEFGFSFYRVDSQTRKLTKIEANRVGQLLPGDLQMDLIVTRRSMT